MRTALYSEIRTELKKGNFDFDYVKNLFNGISWVVGRRSDMVENSQEFIATPKDLLINQEERSDYEPYYIGQAPNGGLHFVFNT